MVKKQYYIPGKEYEWTWETWDTVLKHEGYRDWETDRKSTRLNSSHRL